VDEMILAHRNPRWRNIKEGLEKEFLTTTGKRDLIGGVAVLDWMAENWNIKYHKDDNGYWYATEIPDDIYTLLLLKFVK
jgi:hypothetical protein